jgi:hypothetical protein
MYAALTLALPIERFWNSLPETGAALMTLVVLVPFGALVYGISILVLRGIALQDLRQLFKRNT